MDDGHATMMLSVAVALEFESKCLLAEHRIRIIAGLSVKQAEIDVGGLIAKSQSVQSPFRWWPQLRDPGDGLVLEAAVNGQASAIVTFHLRDFQGSRNSFGIEAIRPGEALTRIGL